MRITPGTPSVSFGGHQYHRQKTGYYLGGRPQGKLHRRIYEATHGPIPPGYVIHHRNEDKNDCRPENLEAITPQDHNARHQERDLANLQKAIAVSTTVCHEPAHKEAFTTCIKTMWKNRQPRVITCIVCGASKPTTCMKPVLYCGTRCKQKAKRQKIQNYV